MSYGDKDLAEVFEEQRTKIETLENKVSNLEVLFCDLSSMVGETDKPYSTPYGEAFIKAVIALVRKTGAKTLAELIRKLQAMTPEELDKIGESIESDIPLYALPTGEYGKPDDIKAQQLARKIQGVG